MELYLDSADISEIKKAFELGFLAGLTTTPTFMHREGISDIDAALLDLAKIVPILQVEALGTTANEICSEAYRQTDMGLDKNKTVYKIPVSIEGVKACKKLRNEGFLVNIHLVYTLQQAYMAMNAGATYVCPLIGRLQDEGQDALGLIKKCVHIKDRYKYETKIMFSSVRNVEHVRNALEIGVSACTIPWKIMIKLTDNHFTTIGTNQFFEHTKLMTQTVNEVMRTENPKISKHQKVLDALVKMTKSKCGAVSVTDDMGALVGIFTDGDFRRLIEKKGEDALHQILSNLSFQKPITLESNSLLFEASKLFKENKVDNIVILENSQQPIGMLDIQDLV